MIDHRHLALLVLFVVVVCFGLWRIIYLWCDTFLEFSIFNAIYIASFDDQKQGCYSINILIKLDRHHHQEQRKMAIQLVKRKATSQFDHFEKCWILTNYLVEIALDPQVSILCSGRAS